MSEREEMLALADELADKLDQMPFGSPNTLLRRVERALRSAATPAPGYAQGFEAALAAYNDVWNNWQELDASNVNECREASLRAAIAALPAPAGVEDWQDISTAPKDRTDILCFIESSKEQFVCFLDGHHWRFGTFPGGHLVCEPTHWRPLPAPPTILAKPAQEGGL